MSCRDFARFSIFVLCLIAATFPLSAQNFESSTITTVAGNGTASFSGDSGPATSSSLNSPRNVAIDSSGNLFIADQNNHRIRRVDFQGSITTVAGNGTAGFSGDGSVATSAALNNPTGVAVDAQGNLFIADSGNARIRKVSPAGTIITIAGNGIVGFAAEGVLAINTSLAPAGVAVDSSGNVFIAAKSTNRIHKVGTNGLIFTVAGTGTLGLSGDGGLAINATLNSPSSVAVDSQGNLFIADSGNARIRRVGTAGVITTVAGSSSAGFSGDGGLATNAQLNNSMGVTVDPVGNFYIADTGNHRVRKVTVSAQISVNAVVNGASFDEKPPASGSIITIFGGNLAASTMFAGSLPLPTVLVGVSVQVNGMAAPLIFVSPNQINLQLPWEVMAQTEVSVTVTRDNQTSNSFRAGLGPFNPGLFAINAQGSGQGAALISGTGMLAAPSGSVSGRSSRAAVRGEFISMFATGLGATTNRPASGAGAKAEVLSSTMANSSVTIGGIPATVSFSGLAPGFVGLYQIDVRVPESVPPGNATPVALTIGGQVSNTVTIAVQ